jgi:hypothetical protein
MHKKILNKLDSHKITTTLALVVIFQLAGLIYSFKYEELKVDMPLQQEEVTPLKSQNYYLAQTLFPPKVREEFYKSIKDNLQNGTSKVAPKMNVATKNTTIKKPNIKADSAKPTPSPTPAPYKENYISTPEARDKDRSIISQLLADKISQYYFLHGIYPYIYSDKSKTELIDIPSEKIYFYNVDQNRTNAMALSLGEDDDTYKFVRVSDCSDHISKENELVFSFDERKVEVCGEVGREVFNILQ